MDDKGFHLLIAVSGSDESVLGPIRESFEKSGVSIGRCDLRTGKDMIMQYLNSFPDTDAIVLSQYQGATQFPVDDIDTISTQIPDIRVIVIVAEEKGSVYMKELEACGIYTAVFEQDADYTYIAKIIMNGRRKKDARLYYGVTGGDIQQGRGFNTENAVIYLSSYDGTINDLAARMARLYDQLPTPSNMLDVLAALPMDVFNMVSRIEKYSTLCGLVEEKRYALISASESDDSGEERGREKSVQEKKKKKKEVKKSPKEKLTNVDLIRMEGRRKTVDVGFISTNIGIGCTTSAILFAHSIAMKEKGLRIALVEFDDADAHFETLCRLTKGERNTSGLTNFTIGSVDYYFNTTYSNFGAHSKPLYDVVVYDFGCCNNETIEGYFLRLQQKFVVCSAKEWHFGELVDFIEEVAPLDVNDSFTYLFPCVNENLDMGAVRELVSSKNRIVAIPYESNPYVPSKSTIRLFRDLYDATWKAKTYKKVYHLEEKMSLKSPMNIWKQFLFLMGMSSAVIILVLIIQMRNQGRRYITLEKQAQTEIAELSDQLRIGQEELLQLEDKVEGLEIQVFYLKEDVAAGTVITLDMVEEKIIQSDIDEELFFTSGNLGHVAAVIPIKKGYPLFDNMVAEPMDEDLEIPIELLGGEETSE